MSKKLPDGKLWLPTSKLPVIETLLEAFDERAAIVFVGEPGVGKTCVLPALRHRIPSTGFPLTYCHNATLGRRDFYRQLCQALGLSSASTLGGGLSMIQSRQDRDPLVALHALRQRSLQIGWQ